MRTACGLDKRYASFGVFCKEVFILRRLKLWPGLVIADYGDLDRSLCVSKVMQCLYTYIVVYNDYALLCLPVYLLVVARILPLYAHHKQQKAMC